MAMTHQSEDAARRLTSKWKLGMAALLLWALSLTVVLIQQGPGGEIDAPFEQPATERQIIGRDKNGCAIYAGTTTIEFGDLRCDL